MAKTKIALQDLLTLERPKVEEEEFSLLANSDNLRDEYYLTIPIETLIKEINISLSYSLGEKANKDLKYLKDILSNNKHSTRIACELDIINLYRIYTLLYNSNRLLYNKENITKENIADLMKIYSELYNTLKTIDDFDTNINNNNLELITEDNSTIDKENQESILKNNTDYKVFIEHIRNNFFIEKLNFKSTVQQYTKYKTRIAGNNVDDTIRHLIDLKEIIYRYISNSNQEHRNAAINFYNTLPIFNKYEAIRSHIDILLKPNNDISMHISNLEELINKLNIALNEEYSLIMLNEFNTVLDFIKETIKNNHPKYKHLSKDDIRCIKEIPTSINTNESSTIELLVTNVSKLAQYIIANNNRENILLSVKDEAIIKFNDPVLQNIYHSFLLYFANNRFNWIKDYGIIFPKYEIINILKNSNTLSEANNKILLLFNEQREKLKYLSYKAEEIEKQIIQDIHNYRDKHGVTPKLSEVEKEQQIKDIINNTYKHNGLPRIDIKNLSADKLQEIKEHKELILKEIREWNEEYDRLGIDNKYKPLVIDNNNIDNSNSNHESINFSKARIDITKLMHTYEYIQDKNNILELKQFLDKLRQYKQDTEEIYYKKESIHLVTDLTHENDKDLSKYDINKIKRAINAINIVQNQYIDFSKTINAASLNSDKDLSFNIQQLKERNKNILSDNSNISEDEKLSKKIASNIIEKEIKKLEKYYQSAKYSSVTKFISNVKHYFGKDKNKTIYNNPSNVLKLQNKINNQFKREQLKRI